jgi:hypothetical protein
LTASSAPRCSPTGGGSSPTPSSSTWRAARAPTSTFANDLLFAAGPGAYLLTGDSLFGEPYTLRAQALFSGETKGNDSIGDVHETDTGITSLYLGPAFGFGWGTHLGVEVSADLPVLQNNTQLQIVPDYRLRGGFSWRF